MKIKTNDFDINFKNFSVSTFHVAGMMEQLKIVLNLTGQEALSEVIERVRGLQGDFTFVASPPVQTEPEKKSKKTKKGSK